MELCAWMTSYRPLSRHSARASPGATGTPRSHSNRQTGARGSQAKPETRSRGVAVRRPSPGGRARVARRPGFRPPLRPHRAVAGTLGRRARSSLGRPMAARPRPFRSAGLPSTPAPPHSGAPQCCVSLDSAAFPLAVPSKLSPAGGRASSGRWAGPGPRPGRPRRPRRIRSRG